MSYLERYTILALTGLATKDMDDDGEKSGGSVPEYITKEQVKILSGLIQKSGADIKKVVEYSQEKTIESIPAESFGEIKDALLKRLEAVSQLSEREPGEDDD